ncbi:hypothetical protein TVAG_368910 [Trichomonas vaginalis G3]|uniref:DUF3447 domain-containing protein n=1 Tax=Trichomonas vaginalis (strain ATCC PRA-98 / G3) TaxID=412133 RepID=A2EUZ7_TRIV3|nr:protein ubiquitination [Trichomonas vaginalis G3]EAY03520.1 hypothetical protein TVAG_368910 [Trichomonas vaginalis G3]KAI5537492.1 protein ubiquitination [Trichomonas vaginalis G3]|eukprot:XP_001315743.1 hypothetical protein [Trichomonas vaginalis G3]
MTDQDIHPYNYSELRSKHKGYIDLYIALYQLKTEDEGDLYEIYNKIKAELIDSKICLLQNIIRDVLDIIPYNNRYARSYLFFAKHISDDYQVKEFNNGIYKEYGIKLGISGEFEKYKSENLDFLTENSIYRAIMYNDKEAFIFFIESEGFDEDQKLKSDLYPFTALKGYSLLELCCYYGAVDCFRLLRMNCGSKITITCLHFSFLSGNPEIMNECLKFQKPDEKCMEYAIISHNIDFVTFLMTEYKLKINLEHCLEYKNLESLLVYFDQTREISECFIYSIQFNIRTLSEYFLSQGANINAKDKNGKTALHYATYNNNKDMVKFLIVYDANFYEKDQYGETALHYAVNIKSNEMIEILLSFGANANVKDKDGRTALRLPYLRIKRLRKIERPKVGSECRIKL